MYKEFDAVIGYEGIKKELVKLCDILKCPEKYRAFGVHCPSGIIFEGEPGTGKTTMALKFIKATGRKSFVCRKTKPNGAFVDEIVKTFEHAKKEAPSIVLLDDIDKYTERCDDRAEEFATVQACIDDLGDCDVFVIATTNEYYLLPESLVREGRLSAHYEFSCPTIEDSEKIIRHYLSDKKIDETVDAGRLARLLCGKSCAALEDVINGAGIIAAYEGKDSISERDIIEACLNQIFCKNGSDELIPLDDRYRVACHEAGHLVMAELLKPGSVTIASIRRSVSRGTLGFVHEYQETCSAPAFEENEKKILILMGGKAATEIIYGTSDAGANEDLRRAFDIAETIVDHCCSYGFENWIQNNCDGAPVQERLNMTMASLISIQYAKAKKILVENRQFLEKAREELAERITITEKEISDIENEIYENMIRLKIY